LLERLHIRPRAHLLFPHGSSSHPSPQSNRHSYNSASFPLVYVLPFRHFSRDFPPPPIPPLLSQLGVFDIPEQPPFRNVSALFDRLGSDVSGQLPAAELDVCPPTLCCDVSVSIASRPPTSSGDFHCVFSSVVTFPPQKQLARFYSQSAGFGVFLPILGIFQHLAGPVRRESPSRVSAGVWYRDWNSEWCPEFTFSSYCFYITLPSLQWSFPSTKDFVFRLPPCTTPFLMAPFLE